MADRGNQHGQGVLAVLKDQVPCHGGSGPALAPRGAYAIDRRPDGVSLCSCSTHNRFTMTFDAYLQHLVEGRIALTPARASS